MDRETMAEKITGEFNFGTTVEETQWFIQNLLPKGHMCFVLAKAGVGKSLWLEALGIHTIHDVDFAGMKTIDGDVLLIDQDSPENVLTKRMISFNNALGNGEAKHKLFIKSMKGYKLSDRTLCNVINDYSSAVLIIIDSLHSVCGKLDPNSTSDMNQLAFFKSQCMTNEKTIIFTHHISQKNDYTLEDLMTGDVSSLAMGNSAITQQADSYYIMGATASNGITDRLYIRPVSKRESIPSKPVVIRLVKTDLGEKIVYDGQYEKSLEDEIHRDIMTLFNEYNVDRTVKEVYDAMGHKYGENAVRKALGELDEKDRLHMSKAKSNMFKYHLP